MKRQPDRPPLDDDVPLRIGATQGQRLHLRRVVGEHGILREAVVCDRPLKRRRRKKRVDG